MTSDPQLRNVLAAPPRVPLWQVRTRTIDFPRSPLLMGIINVTPDSFSDGGEFLDPSAAVEHGLRLASEGADVLDVGGESTRPYATPLLVDEELRRVIPVVERLCERTTLPVSIDTSKAAVARAALEAGVEIINDITGLAGDPEMLPLAVSSRAGICVMHMLGSPQTMQDNPQYNDVVVEVLDYLRHRRDQLAAAGIPWSRVALDPGIGFGKTHEHNLTLLANSYRFHVLGCPLLVGHSRKGYIGKVMGDKSADRVAGTVGVSIALANQGVQMLRVHDVAKVRQALALYEAVGGLETWMSE